jgi:HEAT repeat protein
LNSDLTQLVLNVYDHSPSWLRRLIVRQVASRSLNVAERVLTEAIKDADVEVRVAVVKVAATYGQKGYRSPQIKECLRTGLSDAGPDVRAAAALGVGQARLRNFNPPLERALTDKHAKVRGCAAWSLGLVGRAESIIPLRKIAARDSYYPNQKIAQQSIAAIERRVAPQEEKLRELWTGLCRVLIDPGCSQADRQRAKRSLYRFNGPGLVPILDQALDQTNRSAFHEDIMEILVRLQAGKAWQEVLIRCLHNPSPRVRRLAIGALGDKGDKEAIYYLHQVALDGKQPHTLVDRQDSHLAIAAMDKIAERVRKDAAR